MLSTLLVCWLLAAPPAKGSIEPTPPKPSVLAPSLPELTEEQEAKLDAIVDRFIEADTGKLKGDDARKAMDEFKNLGPEAFFALIRGLNKSAKLDHSCPATIIGKKLHSQLRTSNDSLLLQYARENVGAGVTGSRHENVLRELKLSATFRQSAIKNAPRPTIIGGPPTKP